MAFFDAETWKVQGAALLGVTTANVNHFVQSLEPILNFLIHLGQVGIALFTVLYLFQKWKKIRGSRRKK